MTEREYDCLAAGIVVADHVCNPVDHLPAPGELVTTARMDLAIGGCAANVAADLARLGRKVGLVGTVGRDVFGRFVIESLEQAGVDCGHLACSQSRETSGTLVINTRGEDRRFIHSVGANAEFSGRELTPELLASCRVLYLGGYCLFGTLTPANVREAFRAARQAGVLTVLDVVIPQPADYRPMLDPVLPLTDVFLPNDDEGRLITGCNDPREQAETFRRAGARTVVITCGKNGALLADESGLLRAGSYDVELVDGTGAGDAFAAGFLFGLLCQRGREECLRYASALGASCVRARGATTGVFTAEQLQAFVASHELTTSPVK